MKPLATVLTICLIMVFCATAQAQNVRTWDGNAGFSDLWSDANNWDGPNTLPVTGDDIVLDDANDQTGGGNDLAKFDTGVAFANAGPYRNLTLDGFTLQIDRAPGLEFKGTATVLGGTSKITGSEPLFLAYVDVTENVTINNESSAGIYMDRLTVDLSSGSERRVTLDNDANDGKFFIREMVLKSSGADAAQLTVTSDADDVYIEFLDVTGSTDATEDELKINADLTVSKRTIFRAGASINTEIDVAACMTLDFGQVVFKQGTYTKNGTGVAHSS